MENCPAAYWTHILTSTWSNLNLAGNCLFLRILLLIIKHFSRGNSQKISWSENSRSLHWGRWINISHLFPNAKGTLFSLLKKINATYPDRLICAIFSSQFYFDNLGCHRVRTSACSVLCRTTGPLDSVSNSWPKCPRRPSPSWGLWQFFSPTRRNGCYAWCCTAPRRYPNFKRSPRVLRRLRPNQVRLIPINLSFSHFFPRRAILYQSAGWNDGKQRDRHRLLSALSWELFIAQCPQQVCDSKP